MGIRHLSAALALLLGACVPAPSDESSATTSDGRAGTHASIASPSTVATSDVDAPDPCGDVSLGDPVPIVPDSGLVEISGAVFASDFGEGPSLWVHQDSGNGPVVTRIGLDGRQRQSVTLAGVEPFDWEDIAWAVEPGLSVEYPETKHLFVGDIGDNEAARSQVEIRRFPEPAPAADRVENVDEIVLLLPHGPADVEALVVDPRTGDLLVLTKAADGVAQVLVAPGGAWVESGAIIALQSAGTVDLGFGNAVLAADVDPSGQVIGVRTPLRVLLWSVGPDQTLGEALIEQQPCRAPATFDIFGEALALSDDGYVLVGESRFPELITAHRPGR